MNAAPMLSVSGLTKLYAPMRDGIAGGVEEIDFTVPQGSFFTLLGPSGCGKTTTLRCIAGLEHPDSGNISIAGQVVFDSASSAMVPVHRRDIGMVFQSYAIWPHMSVFENVSFPLRISRAQRYAGTEIRARARRALEMVDLAGFESRSATQLSGGQQQRLALARAVIHEPKLLLLDEPLSNLDVKLREEMRLELKRLQRSLGVTALYVTHDQTEALALSDSIAVLDRGRIVQIGSPDEIYHEPHSEFVAAFIGTANVFHGRMVSDGGEPDLISVRLADGTILRCRPGQGVRGQVDLAVAIRPEAIRIGMRSTVSASGNENVLRGSVQSRIFLGQAVTLQVAAAGTIVLVTADPQTRFAPGDEVALEFPVGRCIAVPANPKRS